MLLIWKCISPLTELWVSLFLDQCPYNTVCGSPEQNHLGGQSCKYAAPPPHHRPNEQNGKEGWKTDLMRLPRAFSYKLKLSKQTERKKKIIREPERNTEKQNQRQ